MFVDTLNFYMLPFSLKLFLIVPPNLFQSKLFKSVKFGTKKCNFELYTSI